MRITNIQKKELSDILLDNDLNISDFTAKSTYDEFEVKFKNDYFLFSINKTQDKEYVVHVKPVNSLDGYGFSSTWEAVIIHYKKWITEIALDLFTTTGWESFESENILLIDPSQLLDPFSSVEKAKVKKSIIKLKDSIESLPLEETTILAVKDKLDQLTIKVDELNKFDWQSLFLGTIASLILTFSIPSDASGLLWGFIKSAFNDLRLSR